MKEQPLIESGPEKVLSLPAETQYAPNGIVNRAMLRTANSRTVLFGFAAGQELSEYYFHPTCAGSDSVRLIRIFPVGRGPNPENRRSVVYAVQSPACGSGHGSILHAVDPLQTRSKS
ncbi:MAG: hypothetical protein ACLQVY_24060 [Limisphaerales bacterium]